MAAEGVGKRTVGTRVPKELVSSLDRIVKNSGGLYKDRADLIRDALRDKIQRERGWPKQN